MKSSHVFVMTLAAALLCGVTHVFAEPQVSGKPDTSHVIASPRTVPTQELYYYDQSGLRIPLPIQTKALVRFLDSGSSKSDAEKDAYLKKYASLSQVSISAIYSRAEFALGYLSTTDVPSMVASIKKLAEDPLLDVAPVVMVDGMDAVVDGIYIEPVTPLSKASVLSGITSAFGTDAMVHEITPVVDERNILIWHVSFKRLFFLGEKKLPLHQLLMANVLDRGEKKPVWVKRAFPKFAYLQDPVVATVSVQPRSGTVGERRTVELSISIFGKNESEVTIDEQDIPGFLERQFKIMSMGKPPLAGFFDHGNPPPERQPRKQVGPNSWQIVHQYSFDLYAPESEWTISDVEIPYLYKGKKMSAKTATVTFFVRPHLTEQYKLSDFPVAYSFPVGPVPNPAPGPSHAAVTWITPIAAKMGGLRSLKNVALLLQLLAISGLVYVGVGFAQRRRTERVGRGDVVVLWSDDAVSRALDEACKSIDSRAALSEMHNVLSTMLNQRIPEISNRNATFQQWKEHVVSGENYRNVAAAVASSDVEELFDMLEQRNDRNFSSNEQSDLDAHVAEIALRVRRLGVQLRETKEEAHGNID